MRRLWENSHRSPSAAGRPSAPVAAATESEGEVFEKGTTSETLFSHSPGLKASRSLARWENRKMRAEKTVEEEDQGERERAFMVVRCGLCVVGLPSIRNPLVVC